MYTFNIIDYREKQITPHYNPESEPFKPCEGCHSGKIRIKTLIVECRDCSGEGWVEIDDYMWYPEGYRDCRSCLGVGTETIRLRYCDEECYYYSNYELY